MDKKGFLLAEEVLKIIIALISISLLAYLLFSLYSSNQDSNKLELAEESLNHFIEELNSGSEQIQIYNPKGWTILSWPFEGNRPLNCENFGWESCICICDKPLIKTSENYLENCNNKGICQENTDGLIVECSSNQQCPIEIKNPPITLNVNYETNEISEER